MPNALDDAMMMSYNWNKGMDERLKKIRETFSPAEIDEGIEFMLWSREERKRQEEAQAADKQIDDSVLQMQDAIENALKTGDPETAIRLKNRLYDIQKTLAREEEIVKATAGTSPPVSYRNMDPKSLQIELNNAILTGNLKKIAEIKRIITGEKID